MTLILLVVALVLFALGTFDVMVRFNPIAAGLACITLAMILANPALG